MKTSDGKLVERPVRIGVQNDSVYVKLLSHSSPDTDMYRPVLLFMHEALGSVGQWKYFPRDLCLATGLDGIVYDRAGHGQSSALRKQRETGFYHDEACRVLPELLDILNIRHPLLVGHSDGATIALKYAANFPELTAAVVSIAAHVIIEDITLEGIRTAKQLWATTDFRKKLARYHGDKTDTVFHAWADFWLKPNMQKWNMLDDLERITCPVLVVQGTDDEYGSRAQVDTIAQRVQGAVHTLWLPGCGHAPHLERSEQVTQAVQSFITSLS